MRAHLLEERTQPTQCHEEGQARSAGIRHRLEGQVTPRPHPRDIPSPRRRQRRRDKVPDPLLWEARTRHARHLERAESRKREPSPERVRAEPAQPLEDGEKNAPAEIMGRDDRTETGRDKVVGGVCMGPGEDCRAESVIREAFVGIEERVPRGRQRDEVAVVGGGA